MYDNGNHKGAEQDSEYEFPPLPKNSARRMRQMRFNPDKIGPIYPGAERVYAGTLPIYGTGTRGPYSAGTSTGSAGPYHETVNPLNNVFDDNTGVESWC